MPSKQEKTGKHVHYHKDGTVYGRGQLRAGVMTGYWEWYRKDGSLMRSGTFRNGEQVAEWTTYGKDGRVVKVTQLKPKPAAARRKSHKRIRS